MTRSSCGTWRAAAKISAQVCSTVVKPGLSVPQQTTPFAFKVARSTDLLRIPEVMNSFRSGNRLTTEVGNGVRSRIAQTTSNPFRRSTSASGSTRLSVNTTGSNPSGRLFQSAMSSEQLA